ncbi:MAG: hypothetical protein C0606_10090 [Hyphomicrobiales bacterium]|nr:MAG: hypothetical protein C0606_10090 [Hyphomicrobiales bacterium]
MSSTITQELDASGLNCPLPILKTRQAIKKMGSGELLRVRSTDPGSVKDIEAFCNQTGHQLVEQDDRGPYTFVIRVQ